MTEPIDIAGGGLGPEEHTPDPACARHARGEMVPLHDVLQSAAQDVDTLRKVRAAHAEWKRTGDLHELARAMTTLLGAK